MFEEIPALQLFIPPSLAFPFPILLILVVLPAAVYDFRFRRIPNWIAVVGTLVGLGANLLSLGLPGLGRSLGGFALGFSLYFCLYLLHAMGAGDVKLMAAVGAIAGARWWIWIFMTTVVVGAILALVLAIAKGRLRATLWNVGYLMRELIALRAPWLTHKALDVKNPETLRLPHGVSIALGTIFSLAAAFLRD